MQYSDIQGMSPTPLGFGTNAKWNKFSGIIDSSYAQASMAERWIALPPAARRELGKRGEAHAQSLDCDFSCGRSCICRYVSRLGLSREQRGGPARRDHEGSDHERVVAASPVPRILQPLVVVLIS